MKHQEIVDNVAYGQIGFTYHAGTRRFPSMVGRRGLLKGLGVSGWENISPTEYLSVDSAAAECAAQGGFGSALDRDICVRLLEVPPQRVKKGYKSCPGEMWKVTSLFHLPTEGVFTVSGLMDLVLNLELDATDLLPGGWYAGH